MYREVVNKIKEYDTIVIARHIGVDPDALCSQLALRDSIKLTYPNKKVIAIGTGSSRFTHLGKLDKLENTPCKETNTDNYITLLPVVDYLNIGSKDSYLANDEYFYLSNSNSEDKIWYVDEDGALTLSIGTDIIGIRPVITIGKKYLNNPKFFSNITDIFYKEKSTEFFKYPS